MKILITGAGGFIGQNLVWELRNQNYKEIYRYDKETEPQLLEDYCREADFVFHLAGVNRPPEPDEFMAGNFEFTATLLNYLKKHRNTCPVLMSSSIQAAADNPYGRSKKAGEDLLFAHSLEIGAPVFIYRLPNVFGKWCRPNYNSAVATFCNNIARDLPITVSDPAVVLNLVYIDDVLREFIAALNGQANRSGEFCAVSFVHTAALGRIVELICSFRSSRDERSIPDMSDSFTSKLYSTYLSYLPADQFAYPLKMNVDNRGSFTEFIKTADRGQVSVNISKAGIVKGNHWHHSKNEKFLVVSGRGVIRFRRIGSEEVIEYHVSGEKLEVVDIPTGYTHNIENLGEQDMVTIMWANELFDPDRPDTYFLEV